MAIGVDITSLYDSNEPNELEDVPIIQDNLEVPEESKELGDKQESPKDVEEDGATNLQDFQLL